MGKLYGIKEDLPDDIGDLVIHDEKPVGPPDDEDTATVDPADHNDVPVDDEEGE